MPNDYATLAELKEHLTDHNLTTDDDTLLGKLLTRASRMIDELSQEKPGGYSVDADVTIFLDGTGNDVLGLWGEPTVGYLATTPTEVAISEEGKLASGDYTVLAATDFLTFPYNATDWGEPIRELRMDFRNGDFAKWPPFPKAVRIKGRPGWSTTPPDSIKEATIIQSVRWFQRGAQQFRDTGAIEALGQLMFTQSLDPDVKTIIQRFRMAKVTL